MNCPVCSREGSRVTRTLMAASVLRVRACLCGATWTTEENVSKANVKRARYAPNGTNATNSTLDAPNSTGEVPPREAEPSKIKQLRGELSDSSARKGGGGVLSFRSELFPVSSPDPSQPSDPDHLERSSKRSPARAKVVAYSGEFERLWEHTGKCRGNKGAAWASYRAIAFPQPLPDAIRFGWDAYMASSGPVGGFVQHLSTWLNQRGWETDWQPAAPKTRDARNTDVLQAWVEKETVHG